MKRRNLLAAGIASSALLAVSRAYAAWPERPISLIVPYPAGGGTDIVARTLAPLLEREIGGTINVLNRPGGGGITGHEAVARSTPDGYTLGMITNDLSFYVPLGQSSLTHRDFAKIGQTNEIAATVTVKPGSPYDTVPKLLAAIRANPGKMRGTGAASGVSWHVAYLGMMDSLGMDPKSAIWVPSQGGTLGHQDVAAGGSEFSTASIGEARALLEADKVKTLAIMSDARIAQFPNIPTLKEATGSGWNFSVAHGVAGPKGLPVPIQERLAAALVKVHASEEFQTQLKNRLIRAIHRTPTEWDAVLDRQLTDFSRLLRAAGLARG